MNAIIKVCKCSQCRAKKRSMRGRTKRFFKRLTNKRRRKSRDTTLMYA